MATTERITQINQLAEDLERGFNTERVQQKVKEIFSPTLKPSEPSQPVTVPPTEETIAK